MARPSIRLTDDQLAAIAWADPAETAVALARRIGAPYAPVASARRRIRHAGGWWCALLLTTCTECGHPLLVPAAPNPRQVHPGCARARHNRRKRRYTAEGRPYMKSSPDYARAWRLRNPERAAKRYADPAYLAASLANLNAARARDQALTRAHADRAGQRWTPEEDAQVLASRDEADRELAISLGRTLISVHYRRSILRKRAKSPSRSATVITRHAPNAGNDARARPLPPVPESLRSTGLLTITAAARQAGVSSYHLRRWIRRNHVRTRRIGDERYITPDDLAVIREEMHLGTVIPAWRHDKPHAGMRLRQLREAAGLTQLEFAAAVGITNDALSLLETGKRSPRAETVRALARTLRVKPERFISRDPIGLSMMTVAQAATRLDVPPSRVQTWLKQGVLEGSKVSGQWRVATEVVDELARSGRLRGKSGRLDPRYHG